MYFVYVDVSNELNGCCLRRTKLFHSWSVPAAFLPSKSHHYVFGALLTSVFLYSLLQSQYIKRMDLGGGMIWALDLDDFKNRCGCGKHLLLKTINHELRGLQVSTSDCT